MNNQESYPLIEKWLFSTFGFHCKNLSLYIQSLTHSSYKNEHNLSYSYENLEFFGDSIIGLIVAKYLFLKYNTQDEGFLTKKKIQIVQAKTLSFLAKKINLDKYLFLGNGFKKNDNIDKILEDSFEALFAAIYLDQGWETCYKIFTKLIKVCFHKKLDFFLDYKSLIQDAFMIYNGDENLYLVEKLKDNSYHATLFFHKIKYGEGIDLNKKNAEKKAAKDAYLKMVIPYECSKKNN